ncbi:MAG: glycosyltransferase family 39 protein [Actinomycetota bacterium]|nr:glycosyltransferase family 39 protein [Actinomycetota bacterium]
MASASSKGLVASIGERHLSGRTGRPLLLGILALGAANFLWQLGSSSLFIDEVLSWRAAVLALHALYENVRGGEISPPGYYFLLHEWMYHTGSQQEWVMRLPSVLAGIALVAAIYWLATLVADRATALLAALGAALSPLVLGFAQESRAYIFAVLLVTVSVAALLEGRRRPAGRARTLWLVAAGAGAIAGFWMHYTADLVLAPVLVWFAWRPGASARGRILLLAVCAAADAILAPLLIYQLGQGHEAGIAASATLTFPHVTAVIGAPFAGRLATVVGWVAIGEAVVLIAVLAGVLRALRRDGHALLSWPILPAAVIPIVVLLAVTIFSSAPVLLTRYAAVAAPFMLILIAFAIVHEHRAIALPLAAAALIACVGETALTHSRSGFYPDTRAGLVRIERGLKPSDFIFVAGYPALPATLDYYLRRDEIGLPIVYPYQVALVLPAVIRAHRRIWFFSSGENLSVAVVQHALASLGYRASQLDHHPGSPPLSLVLAVPR